MQSRKPGRKPKPSGFTRAQRLTKRADFDSTLRHPDIHLTRYPVRLVAKANTLDYARLGMIVSKRNVRLAVNRNRVKRQVREWFRIHGGNFLCYDIVVSVREYSRHSDQLKTALSELLQKWDERVDTSDS